MDDLKQLEKTRAGVVALIGPTNAGKSTLLNAILGDKVSIVSERPHTTRQRIIGVYTKENVQLVLSDSPGFAHGIKAGGLKHFLAEGLHNSTSEVDVIALVLDASTLKRKGALEEAYNLVLTSHINDPHIVVLNKVDKMKKEEILPCIAAVHKFCSSMGLKRIPEIVPVCAQKGAGVEEFVKTATGFISESPFFYESKQVTDQPESFFISEIIREKLFERLRAEIPYSLAVRVDDIRDAKDIMHIFATIYVERPNQKSIVIGNKGRVLKAVGILAREELEKIYGVQINLKLFVKVEEEWTQSEKGLRRVGYVENE